MDSSRLLILIGPYKVLKPECSKLFVNFTFECFSGDYRSLKELLLTRYLAS